MRLLFSRSLLHKKRKKTNNVGVVLKGLPSRNRGGQQQTTTTDRQSGSCILSLLSRNKIVNIISRLPLRDGPPLRDPFLRGIRDIRDSVCVFNRPSTSSVSERPAVRVGSCCAYPCRTTPCMHLNSGHQSVSPPNHPINQAVAANRPLLVSSTSASEVRRGATRVIRVVAPESSVMYSINSCPRTVTLTLRALHV